MDMFVTYVYVSCHLLLRIFLRYGLCAGSFKKWLMVSDGFFQFKEPGSVHGVFMAAGAEEVMVVMPKYTPGHVVLRVEREGGEMALSYAMSGGYFTRLKYRGSETVVDFLFKVLQKVDEIIPGAASRDLQVLYQMEVLDEQKWKHTMSKFFRFAADPPDSSSEAEAALLPDPVDEPKAKAKQVAKAKPKASQVKKKPASLKRPAAKKQL